MQLVGSAIMEKQRVLQNFEERYTTSWVAGGMDVNRKQGLVASRQREGCRVGKTDSWPPGSLGSQYLTNKGHRGEV